MFGVGTHIHTAKMVWIQSIIFNLIAYFTEISSLSTGKSGVPHFSLCLFLLFLWFFFAFFCAIRIQCNEVHCSSKCRNYIRVCQKNEREKKKQQQHWITMTKYVVYPKWKKVNKNDFHLFLKSLTIAKMIHLFQITCTYLHFSFNF